MCSVAAVMSDSLRPPGILQARIPEWVAISFSGGLPYPGVEPASPVAPAFHLLFTAELPGKTLQYTLMTSLWLSQS